MAIERVTLKDLAAELGLSVSTVSMVLSGQGDLNRISKETCEKVHSAAKRMGYRARKKHAFNSRSIAVFLPTDIVGGPIAQIMHGITRCQQELPSEQELDFVLIIYEHGKLHRKSHLLQNPGNIAAAVLMGTQESDITFLRGFQASIPILLVNREAPGCFNVGIDDYEVGRSVAEHFLQRGHRNIGLVAPEYASKSLGLRVSGFLGQLWDHADSLDSPGIQAGGKNSPEGGQAAMEKLLAQNSDITAVFVTNDNMVTGVVHALRSHGRRIPEDTEIISFGDMEVDRWSDPPVTSFAYPVEDMLFDAVQILLRAMEKPGIPPISRQYPAECIYRVSCPRDGLFRPRDPVSRSSDWNDKKDCVFIRSSGKDTVLLNAFEEIISCRHRDAALFHVRR